MRAPMRHPDPSESMGPHRFISLPRLRGAFMIGSVSGLKTSFQGPSPSQQENKNMRFGRLVLSTALVGLATTLVTSSFAQPAAGRPKAPVAAKGAGEPSAQPQPSRPGATPPRARQPRPSGKSPAAHRAHAARGSHDHAAVKRQGKAKQPMPGKGTLGFGGKRLMELKAKEKAGTLTKQEQAQLQKLRELQTKLAARRDERRARLEELK